MKTNKMKGKGKMINKIRKSMAGKKAQEEMFGFVLIMVFVAVIFLVFLGIFLRTRTGAEEKESIDVYHFLEGMMKVTTECEINPKNYLNIGDLIGECYSGMRECMNGKKTCEILNESLSSVINSAWKISGESYIKGYAFNAAYNSTNNFEEIINITKGDCSANIVGAEYLFSEHPGVIVSSLKICY
ncbi:MAG: hypothetical protein N3D20_01860 [Candidatus Pacearchaeota archaeon]|nr:hypothetical protein [Candidatus Pacearchaeota archaeon]